jgi:hypothetical protein
LPKHRSWIQLSASATMFSWRREWRILDDISSVCGAWSLAPCWSCLVEYKFKGGQFWSPDRRHNWSASNHQCTAACIHDDDEFDYSALVRTADNHSISHLLTMHGSRRCNHHTSTKLWSCFRRSDWGHVLNRKCFSPTHTTDTQVPPSSALPRTFFPSSSARDRGPSPSRSKCVGALWYTRYAGACNAMRQILHVGHWRLLK